MRRPAVPTAAIAATPCRRPRRPCRRSPRPCAPSAPGRAGRSAEPLAEPGDLGAVDDRPPASRPALRSPTWNFTELVPTSMTANRSAPKRTRIRRPRPKFRFGRVASPRSRTAATTCSGSSASTASVRSTVPAVPRRSARPGTRRAEPGTTLADLDRTQLRVRRDHLGQEGAERVRRAAVGSRHSPAPPPRHRPRPAPAGTGLQQRRPLLETVVADLLQLA